MAAPGAGCAGGSPPPPAQPEAVAAEREPSRWIVSFPEPPVASRFAGGSDTGNAGTREERMRAYAESIKAARLPRLAALHALGAVVVGTTEYAANAATVELPPGPVAERVEAMRRVPGVSAVQPAGRYQADPAAGGPPRR